MSAIIIQLYSYFQSTGPNNSDHVGYLSIHTPQGFSILL